MDGKDSFTERREAAVGRRGWGMLNEPEQGLCPRTPPFARGRVGAGEISVR